jgi:hypothetical protein
MGEINLMKEIKQICDAVIVCKDCPFDYDCPQKFDPEDWDLEHYEAKVKEYHLKKEN